MSDRWELDARVRARGWCRRAGLPSLGAILAAAIVISAGPAAPGDDRPGSGGFFAGPALPVDLLYVSTAVAGEPQAGPEQKEPPYRANIDLMFGPYITGHRWMKWGELGPDTKTVDSDIGATVALRGEREVVRMDLPWGMQQVLRFFPFLGFYRPRECDLFLGGEVAYAGHHVADGEETIDGELHHFWLLVPIDFDFPILPSDSLVPVEPQPPTNPFSLRIGAAPGVQYAIPEAARKDVIRYAGNLAALDPTLTPDAAVRQAEKRKDNTWVFNLRIHAQIRMPLNPGFGFIIEAAYDWAEEIIDGPRRSLSGLSFMGGFELVF